MERQPITEVIADRLKRAGKWLGHAATVAGLAQVGMHERDFIPFEEEPKVEPPESIYE